MRSGAARLPRERGAIKRSGPTAGSRSGFSVPAPPLLFGQLRCPGSIGPDGSFFLSCRNGCREAAGLGIRVEQRSLEAGELSRLVLAGSHLVITLLDRTKLPGLYGAMDSSTGATSPCLVRCAPPALP